MTKLTVEEFFNLKTIEYRVIKRHEVPEECLNVFDAWKIKDDEKKLEYRKRTRKEASLRAKIAKEKRPDHYKKLTKEYYKNNREVCNKKRNEWEKKQLETNPEYVEKRRERARRYLEKNREKIYERQKVWREQNKKPLVEKIKVTEEQKLERKRLYDIEYRIKNAEKIKERKRIDAKAAYWRKKKQLNDNTNG